LTIRFFKGHKQPMPTLLAARQAMGTSFELALVGADLVQLRAVAEEALAEIESLERRWSAFLSGSQVSHLNRCAARVPVRVEPALFDLLVRARALGIETGGAFDPAIGALMDAWGFRRGPPCAPADADLALALACSGMDNVRLDSDRCTVSFSAAGLQLDLGAIGKGAALDEAAAVCRAAGIQAGLIHAGTSTVLGFGEPASGAGWRVGIPRPEVAQAGCRAADLESGGGCGSLLGEVILRDEALSISAVWGRTLTHEGMTYGHVLDPRTGRPVGHHFMAAVVAGHGFEADALSTALLVGGAPLQDHLEATRPGLRSLVVHRDPGTGQTGWVNRRLL
jgi:FAD:protein FMN transferase